MAENSKIEWTHHTWSPWIGCTKLSPACDGCYAEHLMDTRLGRVAWGPHGERARTSTAYWRKPLAWNRQAEADGQMLRIFPSLCDPFDNQADPAVRREWFDLIRATPHLLWLLLTKRPQNIVKQVKEAGGLPSNVALGTTCEDQTRADQNVWALLQAAWDLDPALTFVSAEPLLGPIDFRNISLGTKPGVVFGAPGAPDELTTYKVALDALKRCDLPRIDWIITGGETDQGQHKARPSHPDWFRSIRDQCAAAGVAYLHKQNGEWADADSISSEWLEDYDVRGLTDDGVVRLGKKAAGRLLDGEEYNCIPTIVADRTIGAAA